MRIPLKASQRYLAVVWLVGASIPVAIVWIQTLFEKYEDKSGEVWNWLLPNITPTLSLIITVVIADALKQDQEVQTVDKFVFTLTIFLSMIYLAVLSAPLLLQPILSVDFLEFIKQPSLFLTTLQGFVGITLGVFFVQKNSGSK